MKLDAKLFIQSEILEKSGKVIHGATLKSFNPVWAEREDDIKKLLHHLNINFEYVIYLDQIHSSDVFVLNEKSQTEQINKKNGRIYQVPESDGIIISGLKNVLAVICTADCVPVLLYDETTGIFGGVHSGWRGAKGRILEKAIEKMKSSGCSPANIKIWIAPAINQCCYEVSDELIKEFNDEFYEFPEFTNGRYLDLIKLNFLQALKSGMMENNIEISGLCTLCSKDTLHSYRANGKISGRIMTFIGLVE